MKRWMNLKILVMLFFVFHVLGICASLSREGFVEEGTLKLLEYDGIEFLVPPVWPITIGFILITYTALLLLYIRNKAGVGLFALSALVALVMELIFGISITTPLENFFGALIGFLWGAILVLAAAQSDDYWKQQKPV